jgi:hypothetical protein
MQQRRMSALGRQRSALVPTASRTKARSTPSGPSSTPPSAQALSAAGWNNDGAFIFGLFPSLLAKLPPARALVEVPAKAVVSLAVEESGPRVDVQTSESGLAFERRVTVSDRAAEPLPCCASPCAPVLSA